MGAKEKLLPRKGKKTRLEDAGEIVKCPDCGFTDDLNGFDVLGACASNVFCIKCHCEFNPDTGKVHRCSRRCKDPNALWRSKLMGAMQRRKGAE